MKYNPKGPARRTAFTLVEILMVLGIIGILIGLLLPALMKALRTGYRTQVQVELGQLEQGLAAARLSLSTDNPSLILPSRIVLHENIIDYNTVDQGSYAALVQIFGPKAMARTATNWIDWNGDLSQPPPGTAYTLTGDKALVFWVGGIPSGGLSGTPSCQGFSTNLLNPSMQGGTRKGPFFSFKPNRLVTDANGFFSYADPYNITTPLNFTQVYAFFASDGTGMYNAGDCVPPGVTPSPGQFAMPYLSNAPTAAAPNNPVVFINSSGVQILCAGLDGQLPVSPNPYNPYPWGVPWTPNGTKFTLNWSPKSGYSNGSSDPGFDDQANFGNSILGNGITN